MSKSKSSSHSTKAHAIAKEGKDVRERVRELTAKSLRNRDTTVRDVTRVIDHVWKGAKRGVSASIPQSKRSVLRQVLDGLGEAADVAIKAGTGVVRDARTRGMTLAKKDAATAAREVRDAHGQFLDAAEKFARRLSGEAREEVEELVAQARKAAPRIRSAAGDVISSADGRLLELGGEAARAGTKIVRNAVGGLMLATGGLLEGMADSISGSPARPTATRRPSGTRRKKKGRRARRKSRG